MFLRRGTAVKKLLVFLLVPALLLSLCSCSGASDSQLLCGTYKAENAYIDDREIKLESMFPEGFEISLKKGGKCEININSRKYSGSWQQIDSSFRAEGAGAVLEGTIGGGVIQLRGVLGSGVSVRLVCSSISERIRRELLAQASAYDYTGSWQCEEAYFSPGSDDTYFTPERFSGSLPFCFELSDFGAAVCVCGGEGFKAFWETGKAGVTLTSPYFSVSLELSAENELTCLGDGFRLLFKRTEERDWAFEACDILYYSDGYSSFPCISFSSDEAAAMSSFMLSGRYLIDSETLFGTVHSRQGLPQFASVRLLSSGDVLVPGSPALLDADCEASYICLLDGRINYIRTSCTDDSVRAVSCLPDGSENYIVYEGPCRYLQAHDGRLWFTDSDARFVSCLPDGTGLEICDVPAPVYAPYFIDGSRFIYQSGSDSQSLHIFNIENGEDIRLTYHSGMNPVICGTDLFFTTGVPGESFCHLCRLDLSFVFSRYNETENSYEPAWNYEESSMNCSSRFAVTGSSIVSYDAVAYPLPLWMNLEDSSWQTRTTVPQYVSKDYSVNFVYDSAGTVSQIIVCSSRLNDSSALPRI